jgi:hypothetical protein
MSIFTAKDDLENQAATDELVTLIVGTSLNENVPTQAARRN